MIWVGFDKSTPNSAIISFINQYSTFENIDETKIQIMSDECKAVIVKTKTNKTCSELHGIINALKTNPTVCFANYTYEQYFGNNDTLANVMSFTDEIVVGVIDENDLKEIVEQTNIVVKKQTEIYIIYNCNQRFKI